MQCSRKLGNGNSPLGKLKQVFQIEREDQVSMARRLLGMRHLSTSKYGQKTTRNAVPANRSVLEQVTL